MTPLLGVGISSVLGALLFWAAGYMMARGKAARSIEASPLGEPRLAALQAELRAREQEVKQVRRELTGLQALQGTPGRQAPALRQELALAQGRLKQAQEQEAQARQLQIRTQQQLEQTRQQLDQLQLQLQPAAPAAIPPLDDEEPTRVSTQSPAEVEVVQLETKLVQTNEKLREADTRADTLLAKVGQLEQGLKQATAERAQLLQEIQPLKAKVEQDRNQLRSTIKERDQAASQLHAANARLELVTRQYETAAGQSSQGQPAVDTTRLEHRIAGLERELQQAQTALDQAQQGLQKKDQELKHAQLELQQAQERARQRHEELATKLAMATNLEDNLKRELQTARQSTTQIEEYRSRLAAADNKLEQLEELQEERYALRQEVEELRKGQTRLAELDEVERDRQDLAVQVGVLRQKEHQLATLQEERAHLLEELEHQKRQIEDLKRRGADLEEAAADRTDLAVKLELLTERTQEMERLQEELDRLKSIASEVDVLRHQVTEQKAEAASLRSQAVRAQAPPVLPTVTVQHGFSAMLDRLLVRLSSSENARSAAIADQLGLLVSGVGPQAEALAAVSAVFTDVGNRAEMLLPMAAIRQLSIVDENAITFTAQPLKTELGALIVATLSVGSGPDAVMLEQAVRETEQIETPT